MLLLGVQPALASSDVCPTRFRNGGAVPGTKTCASNAASSSASSNNFYCSGSSGIDIHIPEYCGNLDEDQCDGPAGQRSSIMGNPINVATGHKLQTETDYQDHDWNGVNASLQLSRYYNSNPNVASGIFGTGWRSTFDRRIQKGRVSTVAYALRHSGGMLSFKQISGGWQGYAHNVEKLVALTDSSGKQTGWQLTLNDNSIETYDVDGQLTSITDLHGERLTLSYQNGLLYRVTDASGRFLEFHYNAWKLVSEVVDPAGQYYRYQYEEFAPEQQRLISVSYPDTTPDNQNDNPTRQYRYAEPAYMAVAPENIARHANRLTGIIDENGARYASFGYDAQGRANLSVHGSHTEDTSTGIKLNADRLDVLYNTATGGVWNVTSTNAEGKQTDHSFQQFGSSRRTLALAKAPSATCGGANAAYSYDTNGFKDRVTDWNGVVTDYDYNAQGLEVRRTEALGLQEQRSIETDWYVDIRLPREIRKPGLTTRFTWENGRLKTRTELDTTTHTTPYATAGATRSWSYTYTWYDEAKTRVKQIRIDGPRTDVQDITVREYNEQGWLNSSSNALGQVHSILEHNGRGQPLRIRDENGVESAFTWHPRGWLQSRTIITPQGNVTTTYEYDKAGQVTKTILPTGVALNYLYDDAHRLQEISTDDNERITWELTALGDRRMERVQSSSGSLRRIVHQEFDDLGRLWKRFGVQDQVLETYGYDANGNPETTTDANQRTITRAFDGLNRLRSVTERDTGATQYEYNAQDQLVSITDPNGLTTAWVVDGFGRKIQETSPDRGTTVYRYDLADNLIQKTDARNSVTKYSYDALNRLTEIQYPASAQDNVSLKYDETSLPTANGSIANKGKGRLTSAIVANGDKIQWAYDALGNITNDVRVQAGKTFQTTYSYNAAGQLTTLTYPSGRELSYSYDNQGRIRQLRSRTSATASWTTLANNVSYEPFGPVTGFTWGNGLTETLSYDTHYQPEAIKTSAGSTDVRSLQYGFNLANELDHLTDAKTPARSQLFSYDPNGRLSHAQGQYGTLAYQYDLTGNRVSQAQTNASDGQNFTESYQYPANTHRLTQVNASGQGGQNRNFQYSAAGNLTQDESYTYVYNDANRLTKIFSGPAIVAEYRYNHLGERISKTIDGKTTQFIYGPNHQLLAEHHQDGSAIRDYVYLGDKLLAMVDADTTTNPGTGTKADLAITLKGATGNSVKQPDGRYQVTYKVNVGNLGGSAAENVVLTNTFPETDVNLVSYTASQGTCTEDASTCNLGTISAGQTATVTLIASKGQKAKESFSASVTTSSEESSTDNNSATAAFGGAFGLWIMAFLTAMLGLRTRFGKKAFDRKNSISAACLVLCGISLMSANTTQAEQIYYVHTDHLNAPTLVTDSNKTVVWEGIRKPFGETDEVVNTVRQPIRFPGQYFDGETGLAYNVMRDYDPTLGRYVQSDPIGLRGGVNTYAYVGGNPVNYIDPRGLEAAIWPGWGWLGSAAEGGAAAGGLTGLGPAIGILGGLLIPSPLGDGTLHKDGDDGSESRPDNCPTGTLPIDKGKKKWDLDKDDVHGIKDGVGAGPKTWTGIDKDGNVWTGGPGGVGENHGHYTDYLP
ncbi:RhsD protein [gamma proteobacterium HdN1]|nr:RhsD protein [gamma proteobacterium HdN1]